jgi:hypothetical protein
MPSKTCVLAKRAGVYEPSAFWERVDFACEVIARNGEQTRTFAACFEMYDGDVVAAAVVRRVNAHPQGRLAQNLRRYLVPSVFEQYEATKSLSRDELETLAANQREAAARYWKSLMAHKDAEAAAEKAAPAAAGA